MAEPYYTPQPGPRRSIAFIGSECYPFVKTGGLADVMYALPKALSRMNCDVKVILPRYACIPWEYQCKMVYRGEFQMNLCSDGRSFYVGIMEYVWDADFDVETRTIDIHINTLRKKLKDNGAMIQTIRGVGYKIS